MDPYIVGMQAGQKIFETTVKDGAGKTPEWNEVFNVDVFSKEQDIITLEVFEKDTLSKDDHIGHCTIEMSILCEDDTLEWFPINYKDKDDKETSAGKINIKAIWKPSEAE